VFYQGHFAEPTFYSLRNYGSPVHDAAVKQPIAWWAEMLYWEVGRHRVNKEELTLPPSVGKDCVQRGEGALQKIQKVPLSCPTPEGVGNVPVNEQGLWERKIRSV
jgi:hypothetical protein